MTPEELVQSHIGLVKYQASLYFQKTPPNIDFETLYAEGLYGLWQSSIRYKPTYKNKFSQYAMFRIKGAMMDYIRIEAKWYSKYKNKENSQEEEMNAL